MSVDRRGLLAGLVGALFGLPGVAALLGSRGARGRWIDAGPLDDLKDGAAKRFTFSVSAGWETREKAAFLVRTGPEVIALDATCTHAGCTVRLGGASGAFTCPCHGGAFSLEGEPVKRPVTRPLARFETRVEDGRVKVRV